MIKHIYRTLLIKIFNLFSGLHFFRIKRFILNMASDIEVGEGSRIVGPIWAGSVSKIKIGRNTFINRNFCVEGNGSCIIGDNVDLGPCVKILTGGHLIGGKQHRAGEGVMYSIKVEDGCWIGAESVVLGNTKIGKGVVVGAASLVLSDVPDDVLVVGHPVQVKRYLNKEEEVKY